MRNTFTTVGQLRHFDGVFAFNTVGAPQSGALSSSYPATRAVNFDGFNGAAFVHNTIYGNLVGGITIEGHEARDTALLNNAIQSPGGTPALPAPRPGVWTAGNVDCTYRTCFMQPDGFDFSPFPGSALVGPGTLAGGEALPREDLFRMRRGSPPTVGAIERPSGPIPLEPW